MSLAADPLLWSTLAVGFVLGILFDRAWRAFIRPTLRPSAKIMPIRRPF